MLLSKFDVKNIVLVILLAGFGAIAGAWIYEYFGYAPCELCLKQRLAYYAGLPLGIGALAMNMAGRHGAARLLLALIGALFAANAALAVYHSGIEWAWWAGPSECTGNANLPASFEDFQKQLGKAQVVRCDKPALWVFGLTLSNWNFLISSGLAILALIGAVKSPSND